MSLPSPDKSGGAAAEGACQEVARLLGMHLDGELDGVKTLEVDDHVADCESCREQLALKRALRGSLKRVVKGDAGRMPEDARARLLASLEAAAEQTAAEDAAAAPNVANENAKPDGRASRLPLRHWRTLLPFASAATIAALWSFAGHQPIAESATDELRAGFGEAELLRELVAVHSRPLTPERTDMREVRALERDVGVPVRPPRIAGNARFVGGRVLPVVHGSERAAMLQYEIVQDNGVQRVSVFIYDPRRVQVGGPGFAARAIGTSQVRVTRSNGYSVAVLQRGDVGYAVASDMDPEKSATLVASADAE